MYTLYILKNLHFCNNAADHLMDEYFPRIVEGALCGHSRLADHYVWVEIPASQDSTGNRTPTRLYMPALFEYL